MAKWIASKGYPAVYQTDDGLILLGRAWRTDTSTDAHDWEAYSTPSGGVIASGKAVSGSIACDCVEAVHRPSIVPTPVRLRRREPAEVVAYFDGALAALRFVKSRANSGVVDIDGMIAVYEAGLAARP